MKNNKGFVMTETLVVTVFLVTIFCFIYVSIVPLIGRYEDIIYREGDIDIVYKLYNIRKMIEADLNKDILTESGKNNIKCNMLDNSVYCNKMMEYLELNNNYVLIYVDNVADHLEVKSDGSGGDGYIKDQSEEVNDYIKKYKNLQGEVLILLDSVNHTIAHLYFDRYHGDDIKPVYYEFGSIPTTSSSLDEPVEHNVYFGLYSTGAIGLCIKITESQFCFRNNEFLDEREHLQRVFSRETDTCNVNSSQAECDNDDFYCIFDYSGNVSCRDKRESITCTITSSSTGSCSG